MATIAGVAGAWIVTSIVLAFGLGRLLGGPLPRGRRFAARRSPLLAEGRDEVRARATAKAA